MTRTTQGSKLIRWLLGIVASAVLGLSAWSASTTIDNCVRVTGLERDIVYIKDALERIEAGLLRNEEAIDRLRTEIGHTAGKDSK